MNYQYKVLSDKAYDLHKNKQYDEAEKIYKMLLEADSEDVNILNLYGLLLINTGKYEDAISFLTKAMMYRKDSYIISNLAKAYYMNNETYKATKLYEKALEYNKEDDIYYSLAIAYKKLNNIEKSISAYKSAIALNPNNTSAYYNLSLLYKEEDDIDNAILWASKACNDNETSGDLFMLISTFYEQKNDYENAIINLEKAIELLPKNHIYYFNLGVLYSKINKFNLSTESYRKSLLLNPKHIETYVNIASVYKKIKKTDIATEYLKIAYDYAPDESNVVFALAQLYKDTGENDKSIELLKKYTVDHNNSAVAHSLIAINYTDTGEYQKALSEYEKAIELEPQNYSYLHGKAVALKYLGKTDSAFKLLKTIYDTGKADSQTIITLGMMYLQKKDFKTGTELYSERNKDTVFVSLFDDKIWKSGEDITDKTVLVYSNCGLGDTIMYSRFLNDLKSKCKSVILQTDSTLYNILKNNFPGITVIKKSVKYEGYDTVIPVMELQNAVDSDFYKMSTPDKYLDADKELTEKYADELLNYNTKKKRKIGICWQGNKRIFKNRSLDFSLVKQFVKDKKYDFYSFVTKEYDQYDENIIPLNKYMNTYDDTAALLKNMDILITIDSSIAHMAGALGVKTFLLLPYTAEWRWFDDTDSTPWYKSIKIFKQTISRDWEEVLDRVKTELKMYGKK